MTSSNGNIFRVTGHLCGEFTVNRWIPHTKASDAELWCFLWSAPKHWRRWWVETLSRSLWRHCNGSQARCTWHTSRGLGTWPGILIHFPISNSSVGWVGPSNMDMRQLSYNIIKRQSDRPAFFACTAAQLGRSHTHTLYDTNHDHAIKGKLFLRYWSFMWGIHRSPVNSPHKGQWRGALMFSLTCTLSKRSSKQSWGWWFETPSRSLWRHCNASPDQYQMFCGNNRVTMIYPTDSNLYLLAKSHDRTGCCF